eukprot:CAMPEP_0172852592 /NCGR_PEP_ID=MMETSP1075-20121228/54225_1 /TAXON_ID=2916 /ORGANISM="Ceratium fusus, Strain PA161109" /LENGTH=99 /DNA_ID=CAMNT_0013698905 /DNA_START=127 /DNA_END=427 /DNA_ORIENTATION=-
MPQHVGQDEVPNLGAAEVDLLKICHLAIPACHGDPFQHGIHVVLAIHQVTSVHFASLQFAGDRMPNALMEQLYGDAEELDIAAAAYCQALLCCGAPWPQ